MIISKPKRIKLLRLSLGLSLRKFSNISGVNISTISRIENIPSSVYPTTAKKISAILNVDISEVFDISVDSKCEVQNESNSN